MIKPGVTGEGDIDSAYSTLLQEALFEVIVVVEVAPVKRFLVNPLTGVKLKLI